MSQTIVLLDYETNCDFNNIQRPLSHAYLIKAYIEGLPPFEDVKEKITHHHYYCGKRVLSWTTEETTFKEINHNEQNDAQLLIEFDF